MADEAAVGRVLGTEDATPLEFWVGVGEGSYLQLDDVVALERSLPGGEAVRIYGIVSQVRARHEGARFDSDVFLIEDGVLPAEVSEAALVSATRFEPEVFVPPLPGERGAQGVRRPPPRGAVLRHDAQQLPAGLSRDDEPFFLNLEFLDGTRGAHVNISGISGVATKTTYATFLLYSLVPLAACSAPRRPTRRPSSSTSRARTSSSSTTPTSPLPEDGGRAVRAPSAWRRAPFASVAVFAPPVEGRRRTPGPTSPAATTACRRSSGRSRSSASSDCCRSSSPTSRTTASSTRWSCTTWRPGSSRRVPAGDGGVNVDGQVVRTFRDLVDLDRAEGRSRRTPTSGPAEPSARARSTPSSAGSTAPSTTCSTSCGPTSPGPSGHAVDFDRAQVTVVDLHNLNDRAKRFVVGVILRQAFERKERSGQARPLQFVVLDELNKYAPREGSSPIKELLLDVAERGRSLGIILIGAQQTASEVERRVVANSAIRVVGRLDAAEAARGEYGFLPAAQRQRATIIKPGTMVVSQPEVPIPIVVQFPFPAWATRASEAGADRPPAVPTQPDDPFEGF